MIPMRTILHSDCNNFYASVECALHPELRGKPLAVCGSKEKRHGIVLAKNELAKACGVKTGDAIWQAVKKCPILEVIHPHHGLYGDFSRKMQKIYADYTDQVEPFGLDECWLDVTGCQKNGVEIAAEIRKRAKADLGITASVGVSFNKVFAKLGSDLRKPDATTIITPENFKEKLWPLPAGDLLFVGRRTRQALSGRGLYTIGDVARADLHVLRKLFGKSGEMLKSYALGLDDSPVQRIGNYDPLKSIGNSTTTPRDLMNEEDAKIILYALCDSVAARLRENGMKCRVVALWVRDNALSCYERQRAFSLPTNLSRDLFDISLSLLRASYAWDRPIRSLGVRCANLVDENFSAQTLLFQNEQDARREKLERTIDEICLRHGASAMKRAVLLSDPTLIEEDIRSTHGASPLRGAPDFDPYQGIE
ncbi:MAG: DNA polymerase IV [Clostridia bacterium]|nr:DNA polymerase IV [Clostridia bacterium]